MKLNALQIKTLQTILIMSWVGQRITHRVNEHVLSARINEPLPVWVRLALHLGF